MGISIERFPVHLGLGARAVPQPEFTGMEWYAAYSDRNAGDGREGRLVSMYTFTENWTSWEMHPAGDEVVICVAGTMTLHQEKPDGTAETLTLVAGEYAINAPDVWHTADIDESATAVFITAGEGTQHRPR
ncbi:MAG: cupin [Proteobacteria bacterium]|nr:cupin [Pseudomonadota bacterium]